MKESLEDYTRIIRGRYSRRTGKQASSLLLNEYCKTTGLERKYAIKVLRGQRRKPPGSAVGGSASTYTGEDIALLKGLWLAAGQPCGKRLAGAMLKLWLASWEKYHGRLEEPQRKRLESRIPPLMEELFVAM